MKTLLENGSNLNQKGISFELNVFYGKLPLVEALDRSNIALAKYLVDKGSDVNAVDNDQNNALLKACEISKTIVEFLVEKGAMLNVKDEDGNSPMHIAAENGSSSICRFLHEKNVQINAKNNSNVYF